MVIDCSTAKVTKECGKYTNEDDQCVEQVCGGHSAIKAIAHFKKSHASHALITSDDGYVIYDFHKQAVIETIVN